VLDLSPAQRNGDTIVTLTFIYHYTATSNQVSGGEFGTPPAHEVVGCADVASGRGKGLNSRKGVNRMFVGGLMISFFWFLALAMGRAGW
jgi:hypothetical protein